MLVLDANAAIEVALGFEYANFVRETLAAEKFVISSEIMLIECANALRKYEKGKYVNKKDLPSVMIAINHLVNEFYPIKTDAVEALSESIRLNHSPYDMLYLVLARRHGATLLSFDRALLSICSDQNISCLTFDTVSL